VDVGDVNKWTLGGQKEEDEYEHTKRTALLGVKFHQHLPIDPQPPVWVDNLGCSGKQPEIEACASLPCILGSTASSTRNQYPAPASCELLELRMATIDVSSIWTERSITRLSLCAQCPGPRSRRCSSGERLLVDKWLVEASMAGDFGENHSSRDNLRYTPCSST
jgi:hypothetical protein